MPSVLVRADVPEGLGSGNIGHNRSKAAIQLKALNSVSAGMCRIPISPKDYVLEMGQPHSERLDDQIRLVYHHGIEPVSLFEYHTR